jgi:RNA polymerase sigma factor, sigma-70 family
MNEREFNRAIISLRPKLIHFAKGFTWIGYATPEDMVQDAILKVWKMNAKGVIFRNIEAMCVEVLKNVCLDYLRLKKNNNCSLKAEILTGDNIVSVSENPQLKMEVKEKLVNVMKIVESLPLDQQMTLRLRDVMGYEFKEIAQIIGTSEGNVRVLLSRARQNIVKNYKI